MSDSRKNPTKNSTPASTFDIQHLHFAYQEDTVIDDLSFKAQPEELLAVIGKNGSGKSTLLKLMSGYLKASRGNLFLDGKAISSIPSKDLAKRLAYLPQFVSLPNIKAIDVISYGRYAYLPFSKQLTPQDKEKIHWAIEMMGIEDLVEKDCHALSGGEIQKVLLTMILAQDTRWLLLDEPATHLDLYQSLQLFEHLKMFTKDLGKGIIMVVHDLNQALRFADRILLIDDGKSCFTVHRKNSIKARSSKMS